MDNNNTPTEATAANTVSDDNSADNAQPKNMDPPGKSIEELQQDETDIQDLSLLAPPRTTTTTKATLSADETADIIEITKFVARAFECDDVELGTSRLKDAMAILSLV